MKIAIMQPYFLPYLGYFQLIANVDTFVIYDNIQYTKKGWINRNRMLQNGLDVPFTIPLKKDSDFLDIDKRCLSDSWEIEKEKLLNKISNLYKKAPFFKETFNVLEACFGFDNKNLFEFIFNSIKTINAHLNIETEFIFSSLIPIDHNLKASEKVIAICKQLKASTYINPIGGQSLYDKHSFIKEGISLHFLKSENVVYNQFGKEFIPFLSILDIMMFNSLDTIKLMLKNKFELL